jgi:hypothetical protein
MSRAHAVAPMVGADISFRRLVQGMGSPTPGVARRTVRPTTSCYFERAMLLWPRLDRAKVRKVAGDPARIAEIVERRTSQPFDVILAMLTKQIPPPASATDDAAEIESERPEGTRVALRIVRSEEGNAIQVQDLLPA